MFDDLFNKLVVYEGYYANDPLDLGKETYMGISRRAHPAWEGWVRIDSYKKLGVTMTQAEDRMKRDNTLDTLVKAFYRTKYWTPHKLNLERLSRIIPNTTKELFDISVNMGVFRAATFLQRAINILNRDELNYPDITVDGYCGPRTREVLLNHFKDEQSLRKLVVLLKAKFYIDLVENRQPQERFIRGWLSRIQL